VDFPGVRVASDDVVPGWRRLDHKLDHPLGIRSIGDVWIDNEQVCLLQDSIDTAIAAAVEPPCISDVDGEEAQGQ